jgi:23S rRNA pseudouridine2604 synthase
MIRLSKLMSERGICSRREADRYIEAGLVYVNGEKVDQLGTKVAPDATIRLAQEAKRQQREKVTIVLHKPIGYVSCQPEKGYRSAIELIPPEYRKGLAVAGRLDIDSAGLLLLTQDGALAKQIIGEECDCEKEYLVRVNGELSDLSLLRHGLSLDGKPLKPAKVEWLHEGEQLRFVLKEGKKRQIRRMCEACGLKVLALKRVRIGTIMLGNLKPGEWRLL